MGCGTSKVADDGIETQKHKRKSQDISEKTSVNERTQATYLVNGSANGSQISVQNNGDVQSKFYVIAVPFRSFLGAAYWPNLSFCPLQGER